MRWELLIPETNRQLVGVDLPAGRQVDLPVSPETEAEAETIDPINEQVVGVDGLEPSTPAL